MSNNTIPISVIIPSYTPGSYIYECLDSLRMQTLSYKEFEVVLILNGCKEPYESELKAYAKRYEKVINLSIFQTDTPGVSNARNIGIEKSRGKYVAFIDDDDFVSPQYLAELYTVAKTGVVPISYIVAFTDGQNEAQPYYITDLYEQNETKGICKIMELRGFMSIAYCKLLDRDLIGKRRFDTRFSNGEDVLFMASISNIIKYMKLVPRSAVYYRRLRKNSAVTKPMSMSVRVWKSLSLCMAYIRLYFSHPFSYNPLFFATRILASLRGIFVLYDTYTEINASK